MIATSRRAPTFVTSRAELEAALRPLVGAPVLAIDTESNSLHAYREKVCWIQLAARGHVVLVDTVAFRDVDVLGELLSDRRTVKILHGADYDVVCLRRDFGFRIEGLFDTMIAAQMLGYEQFGLGAVLERHFGVVLDKSLAKHDWGARPLDRDVIPYLVSDVEHLEELAYRMRDELRRAGCVEEARLEFARVAALIWNGVPKDDPHAFRSIKGARDLDRGGLAVLRELHRVRETAAERMDVPTFRVIGNAQLIEIAQRKPRDLRALGRIPGCTERVLRRLGAQLLDAVVLGLGRQADVPLRGPHHRTPRPSEEDQHLEDLLRAWRKERVEKEGRPPLVVLPNHVLARIVEQRPDSLDALAAVEGLGQNRLRRYGRDLLRLVASAPR